MRIKVTKLDIARGAKGEPTTCPIARAVKRAYNWNREVQVGVSSFSVSPAGDFDAEESQSFPIPERAQNFISDFDNYGPDGVEPFSFPVARATPFKRGPKAQGW